MTGKIHDYWCCKADFPQHEPSCKNYTDPHDYPPVWDETLKAWINNPPWGKPGQGAKL
jgi:hypothetical protein